MEAKNNMNLSQLQSISRTRKKRLGQGHGSGRSKTSGRGTKGQKARRKIPLFFEGGALPLIKRLPFMRGKGRNYSIQQKPVIVKLGQLSNLPKKSVVTLEMLVKKGIVREKEAKKFGVKILSSGDINVELEVKLPASKSAKEKIEKAGGSVSQGLNE